jgi:hypothetical protein
MTATLKEIPVYFATTYNKALFSQTINGFNAHHKSITELYKQAEVNLIKWKQHYHESCGHYEIQLIQICFIISNLFMHPYISPLSTT